MADTLISNPRPTTGEELEEITLRIDWLRGKGYLPLGEIPMPPKPESEPAAEPQPERITANYRTKPENRPWGY